MADCRLCKRFISLARLKADPLGRGLLEDAEEYIRKYRPNERILGWCSYFNRPVTYYEGNCSAFLPKRKNLEKNMLLTDFLKGENS